MMRVAIKKPFKRRKKIGGDYKNYKKIAAPENL